MRLVHATVRRFFGIDDAELDLRAGASEETQRLTLIVGPNGSGKSSMLQALQFFVENFPYLGAQKDRSSRSLRNHECWKAQPQKPGLIRLKFALDAEEQMELLRWRRLGILNHVKHALEELLRAGLPDSLSTDHQRANTAVIEKLLSCFKRRFKAPSQETGPAGASSPRGLSTADDAPDEEYDQAAEDFWRELEESLEEGLGFLPGHLQFLPGRPNQQQNLFQHVIYELNTYHSDPSLAQYAHPRFCAATGEGEPGLDIAKAEFAVICERIDRAFDQVGGSTKVVKRIKRCVEQVHIPRADLTRHLNEFYHKFRVDGTSVDTEPSAMILGESFKTSPANREMTLADDFVFARSIKASWSKTTAFVSYTQAEIQKAHDAAQKERGKQYDPDARKYIETAYVTKGEEVEKVYYDGSAEKETRAACRHPCCPCLKYWKTRRLTDPLLVSLHSATPFPAFKAPVEEFIEKEAAKAFGSSSQRTGVDRRNFDMGFILGALLRSSMAWVQQGRRRVAASTPRSGTSDDGNDKYYPPAGLFDLAAAEALLTNDANPAAAVQRVSDVLVQVIGTGLRFQPFKGSNRLVFDKGGGDVAPVDAGSGGQRECLLLVTVAMLSKSSTLFIDEPANCVHQGAQINVLGALKQACADTGKHIVLVTHSEKFVDKQTIQNCLLASPGEHGCTLNPIKDTLKLKEKEMDQLSMPPLSEILFSDKILLVEGSSDCRLARILQQQLLGADSESEAAHVIEADGRDGLPLKVASALRREVVMVLDVDKVVNNLKKGSQASKNLSLQPVKAKMRDIDKLMEAVQAPQSDQLRELKKLAMELKIDQMYEQAEDGIQGWRNSQGHTDLLELRELIWEASEHRLLILERDIEEEFLRHDRLLAKLSAIYNGNEPAQRREFIEVDDGHADLASVRVYLHHLIETARSKQETHPVMKHDALSKYKQDLASKKEDTRQLLSMIGLPAAKIFHQWTERTRADIWLALSALSTAHQRVQQAVHAVDSKGLFVKAFPALDYRVGFERSCSAEETKDLRQFDCLKEHGWSCEYVPKTERRKLCLMPSTEVLTTAFASVDFEYNEHNCQDVLQQLLEWDSNPSFDSRSDCLRYLRFLLDKTYCECKECRAAARKVQTEALDKLNSNAQKEMAELATNHHNHFAAQTFELVRSLADNVEKCDAHGSDTHCALWQSAHSDKLVNCLRAYCSEEDEAAGDANEHGEDFTTFEKCLEDVRTAAQAFIPAEIIEHRLEQLRECAVFHMYGKPERFAPFRPLKDRPEFFQMLHDGEGQLGWRDLRFEEIQELCIELIDCEAKADETIQDGFAGDEDVRKWDGEQIANWVAHDAGTVSESDRERIKASIQSLGIDGNVLNLCPEQMLRQALQNEWHPAAVASLIKLRTPSRTQASHAQAPFPGTFAKVIKELCGRKAGASVQKRARQTRQSTHTAANNDEPSPTPPTPSAARSSVASPPHTDEPETETEPEPKHEPNEVDLALAKKDKKNAKRKKHNSVTTTHRRAGGS